jgi:hypothetical protein
VLLKSAERVMVDMINLTGLRINATLRKVHLQNSLQFVAGLGPRKSPLWPLAGLWLVSGWPLSSMPFPLPSPKSPTPCLLPLSASCSCLFVIQARLSDFCLSFRRPPGSLPGASPRRAPLVTTRPTLTLTLSWSTTGRSLETGICSSSSLPRHGAQWLGGSWLMCCCEVV